jgi:hypothetical protein
MARSLRKHNASPPNYDALPANGIPLTTGCSVCILVMHFPLSSKQEEPVADDDLFSLKANKDFCKL